MNSLKTVWSQTKWIQILDYTKKACNLTEFETEKLKNSNAAELIGSLPFLSDCRSPERIAVTHLSTFISATRVRSLFDQKSNESIQHRLEAINHFPGGNKEIVKAGFILLEILAIYNNWRTVNSDATNNIFNICSKINPKEKIKSLEMQFFEMDDYIQGKFYYITDQIVPFGYWY